MPFCGNTDAYGRANSILPKKEEGQNGRHSLGQISDVERANCNRDALAG